MSIKTESVSWHFKISMPVATFQVRYNFQHKVWNIVNRHSVVHVEKYDGEVTEATAKAELIKHLKEKGLYVHFKDHIKMKTSGLPTQGRFYTFEQIEIKATDEEAVQ